MEGLCIVFFFLLFGVMWVLNLFLACVLELIQILQTLGVMAP